MGAGASYSFSHLPNLALTDMSNCLHPPYVEGSDLAADHPPPLPPHPLPGEGGVRWGVSGVYGLGVRVVRSRSGFNHLKAGSVESAMISVSPGSSWGPPGGEVRFGSGVMTTWPDFTSWMPQG